MNQPFHFKISVIGDCASNEYGCVCPALAREWTPEGLSAPPFHKGCTCRVEVLGNTPTAKYAHTLVETLRALGCFKRVSSEQCGSVIHVVAGVEAAPGYWATQTSLTFGSTAYDDFRGQAVYLAVEHAHEMHDVVTGERR